MVLRWRAATCWSTRININRININLNDYYNPVIDYYNPIIDYYNPVIDYYNPLLRFEPCLKDVRAQKFPRTDFFKTCHAER